MNEICFYRFKVINVTIFSFFGTSIIINKLVLISFRDDFVSIVDLIFCCKNQVPFGGGVGTVKLHFLAERKDQKSLTVNKK